MSKPWYVYVVTCSDESLYCGITTDVSKRIHAHNHTKKGAKYTRSRRPVRLIFRSKSLTRSRAASIECKFKKLTRNQKIEMIKDDKYFNDHFNIDNSTADKRDDTDKVHC